MLMLSFWSVALPITKLVVFGHQGCQLPLYATPTCMSDLTKRIIPKYVVSVSRKQNKYLCRRRL